MFYCVNVCRHACVFKTIFVCVYLSSGAVGHSSVHWADRWVMSLLWAGGLLSRCSALWIQRKTSLQSSLHWEVYPSGRNPPLFDREKEEEIRLSMEEWMDGGISIICLSTLDKITIHTANGASETPHCFILLNRWPDGRTKYIFYSL